MKGEMAIMSAIEIIAEAISFSGHFSTGTRLALLLSLGERYSIKTFHSSVERSLKSSLGKILR